MSGPDEADAGPPSIVVAHLGTDGLDHKNLHVLIHALERAYGGLLDLEVHSDASGFDVVRRA